MLLPAEGQSEKRECDTTKVIQRLSNCKQSVQVDDETEATTPLLLLEDDAAEKQDNLTHANTPHKECSHPAVFSSSTASDLENAKKKKTKQKVIGDESENQFACNIDGCTRRFKFFT